jgi:hypothetical protein
MHTIQTYQRNHEKVSVNTKIYSSSGKLLEDNNGNILGTYYTDLGLGWAGLINQIHQKELRSD